MATCKTRILGPLAAALIALGGCSGAAATPSLTAMSSPSLTAAPTASPLPAPTASPTPTPKPTASPVATPDTSGVATRLVIAALKIDLPVVEVPSPPGFPYCNVASRWSANGLFVSPGLPGATYILAYARSGMFLPLLLASQVNNGKALIGKKVEVYTSADWRFTYSMTAVHRHVATDDRYLPGATSPELWLQTGESPTSFPILLVAAALVSASPSSHAVAQPSPKPVVCP